MIHLLSAYLMPMMAAGAMGSGLCLTCYLGAVFVQCAADSAEHSVAGDAPGAAGIR